MCGNTGAGEGRAAGPADGSPPALLRSPPRVSPDICGIRLSGQRDSLQHPETLDEFSDDISTILLGSEESNESLQGQPRSSGSPPDNLSSELNSNSAQSSASESRRRSDSLGDYKQNFPFEPPRTQPTRHERAGGGCSL